MASQRKDDLLRAAQENRVEPLRQYLGHGGQIEDVRNGEKQTLLHIAAKEGSEDSLAVLLQNPKVVRHIDVKDRAKRTALHLAAAMGFDTCIKRLLDANASLELKDERGSTPLVLAVNFGWADATGLLLKAGADPLVKDRHGANCVEIASKREDADALKLLVEYAHRRKPSSRWSAFLPCGSTQVIAPIGSGGSAPTPGGHQSPAETSALVGSRWNEGGVLLDDVPAASVYGASLQALSQHPEPEQRQGLQHEDDVVDAEAVEFDYEIEWHGLEAVMVPRGGAAGAGAGAGGGGHAAAVGSKAPGTQNGKVPATQNGKVAPGQAAKKPPQQPSQGPAAHTTDDLKARQVKEAQSRAQSAPPGQRPKAKVPQQQALEKQHSVQPLSAAQVAQQAKLQSRTGSQGNNVVAQEFAIFRRHAFFNTDVKRLEFEVEWKADQPRVGVVKPGGEADQRGILYQDRIVEIAGSKTAGKGREDLLPLLKARPLLLKVDREEPIVNPEEPHIELEVTLAEETADPGFELWVNGQLPSFNQIRPQSDAWRAGLLEGDALLLVNGQPTVGMNIPDLEKMLSRGPVLTLWRRPMCMDLSAPWSAPRGH